MYNIDFENEEVFYTDSEDEEENLIFKQSEIKKTWNQTFTSVWNYVKLPLTKITLHINIHLNFLSLLEPLFYFLYASELEKDILIGKLNDLFKTAIYYIDIYINKNPSSKNYIKSKLLEYKQKYEEEVKEDVTEKNNYNHSLVIKSFTPFFITSVTVIILMLLTKKYTKINITNIYLEHLILMFFIGLYEYWIFKDIIMNYKAITDPEIKMLLIDELYDSI